MEPKLNQLLHWAVENTPTASSTSQSTSSTAVAPVPSSGSGAGPLSITYRPTAEDPPPPAPEKKKLDTAILDAILGKTDALRMREAISIFEDPTKSIHERCNAGLELEELIQDLDNANDMEVLGLWPKLMTLLVSSDGGGENDDLIKFHACWICGTAVQNNPKSQIAFLKRDPLPVILEIVSHGSEETQAKALYCLSSTLKHAPEETKAMSTFAEAHGWEALHNCLRGPSMTLRRKTVFLINTLLLEESVDLDQLRSSGLLATLIASLSPSKAIPAGQNGDLSGQDEDYTEKALRTVATILINSASKPNQALLDEEKRLTKEVVMELETETSDFKQLVEASGIGESEWSQISQLLGL